MRFLLLALAALACSASPAEESRPLLSLGAEQAQQYIVALVPGVEPRGLAAQHGLRPTRVYTRALNGFAADIPAAALDGLRRNPNVQFVSPVGRVQTFAVPSWGLDRINQRNLPLDGLYSAPNNGAGVRVYVLDTGVMEHAELLNRAGSGYDAIDNDMDASDCQSHGTHVAGTVAGTTVGIAKQATIMSVRVLDCFGSGTTEQVLAGIDWTIANHVKPAVVNASWGSATDLAIDAAVRNVVAAGITWVSAAGNSNRDACLYSPAGVVQAYTAGASDRFDGRSYFSNWGTCVDLFAPGSDITSLHFTGGYSTKSGTSMASPHVAGLAAIYLAANPLATPAAVMAAITGGTTSGVLSNVGTGSPNRLGYNGIAGAGVLAQLPRPNPSVHPTPNFVAPVHVVDLDAAPIRTQNGWAAGVRVRVVDGSGQPVYLYGVTFQADPGGYSATCTLTYDGSCTAYRYVKNNVKAVTLTVLTVGNGSLYDPAFNSDPDGDSNGTTITVRKP